MKNAPSRGAMSTFKDRGAVSPCVCPIPDVDKFPFDGTIPTTIIFEHFAEHSESGGYSVLLERKFGVCDVFGGSWLVTGIVVSNMANVLYTQRIVATQLRLGNNRQMDKFVEYVEQQFNEMRIDVEKCKNVYLKFGLPYGLSAQTETDRAIRKVGSVSELAIEGVVVRKIENDLFEDLFGDLIDDRVPLENFEVLEKRMLSDECS